MSPESSPILSREETSWQDIERQVEALAALGQSAIDPPEFYQALLASAVPALGASEGKVWGLTGGERICIAKFATALCETESPTASPEELISCGINPSGDTRYRIELTVDPELPASGAERLLDVFRDVALQYHRERELAALRAERSSMRGFEDLVQRLHGSLDPVATAYAIANDGRHWLPCDRLSVVESRDKSARVLAVSGVDEIDRRSEEVQRLAHLAAAAALTGEGLEWAAGDANEFSPRLAAALEAYVDRSHAAGIAIAPLRRSFEGKAESETFALLVAERFAGQVDHASFRRRLDALERHAGCALAAALEHHQLPMLKAQLAVGRLVRKIRRRPIPFLLAMALLLGVAAVLTWTPMDFTVEASGALEPEVRRHVFAPADGVIEELLVDHGQTVAAEAPLARLRSPQLQLDLSRVMGELQTAQARLTTVRAQRSSPDLAQDAQADDRRLAAEEEQLRSQIEGLQAQQQVLRTSLAELQLTSPIRGTVMTWSPRERLLDRPVRRGQVLLTIADPESPWTLELEVRDKDIGHVLAARHANADLRVEFLLGADATTTHWGRIRSISQQAESVAGAPPTITATALLDESLSVESLAGASVAAKIHCGRRSIAYVWLHDLVDAVRSKLFF
jgi:multidrug efflux pump subunit AcrA (membrane-fusion protein)